MDHHGSMIDSDQFFTGQGLYQPCHAILARGCQHPAIKAKVNIPNFIAMINPSQFLTC
jgi:hypothetical protein